MNQADSLKVVRVTNISDFDFTGDLGARYDSVDYTLLAGESKMFPFVLADHLATHLARQILLKKAPIRDGSQTDGKGSDRPLWDDKIIHELKAKIMTELYTEEREAPKTEAERMRAKVEELNRSEKEVEKDAGGGNAPFIGTPVETTQKSDEIVYQDKQQVISELTKRGIRFDPRSTKTMLESFLK